MLKEVWEKPSQVLSELLPGERARAAITKTLLASVLCKIFLALVVYARDLSIIEMYLCGDFDRSNYECKSTVFVNSGAKFKISETPHLYLITSVESNQEQKVVHAWHFAGERVSEDESHAGDVSYWDDERRMIESTVPIALTGFLERLIRGNLGEAVAFISLTVSPSPAYHTYSVKSFNASHIGPWTVRVLDRSSGEVKKVIDFEITQ